MAPAGKQAQIFKGLRPVGRFAQDAAVQNDNGVGGDDQAVRRQGRGGAVGFFSRQGKAGGCFGGGGADNEMLRGFVRQGGGFRAAPWRNQQRRKPQIPQEGAPPRRV
jgi:hypothetical protein